MSSARTAVVLDDDRGRRCLGTGGRPTVRRADHPRVRTLMLAELERIAKADGDAELVASASACRAV
jgi:hypothetical protein